MQRHRAFKRLEKTLQTHYDALLDGSPPKYYTEITTVSVEDGVRTLRRIYKRVDNQSVASHVTYHGSPDVYIEKTFEDGTSGVFYSKFHMEGLAVPIGIVERSRAFKEEDVSRGTARDVGILNNFGLVKFEEDDWEWTLVQQLKKCWTWITNPLRSMTTALS